MTDLILAILFASSINLGFALAGKRGLDTLNLTLANYAVACAVSALGLAPRLAEGAATGIEASAAAGIEAGPDPLKLTICVGVLAGAMYLAAFLFVQRSVLLNGPSATTMFNRLGMLIPVLASVFVFGEHAGPLRWTGTVLAAASLLLFNMEGRIRLNGLLMGSWLFSGGAELANKLFAQLCPPEDKPLFMTVTFGVAGALTAALLARRKGPALRAGEAAFGAGLGAVNLCSASFTVSALQKLPAGIVYPTLSVSVIVITAIAGRAFFSDSFRKRQIAALAVCFAAIVLLNI